jgi:murein DD-endopeptidase MepM/ murein hydrolase activator NlpD
VLPGVLLAAAGTAFAGLAVMPTAAAEPAPRVTVAQALAPVELPTMQLAAAPSANVALMDALQKGSDIANAPAPLPAAVEPAPVDPRVPVKASRDRSAAAPDGDYVRPGTGRMTSGYGRRWGRLHAGIDLAAGTGSPIRAVAGGTVIAAGNEGGYGNCVRIQHADGSVSLYGHMSSLMVRKGAKVGAGDQIGREGNTGQSTGPHLHFEIRINDVPINPVPWLAKHGINV